MPPRAAKKLQSEELPRLILEAAAPVTFSAKPQVGEDDATLIGFTFGFAKTLSTSRSNSLAPFISAIVVGAAQKDDELADVLIQAIETRAEKDLRFRQKLVDYFDAFLRDELENWQQCIRRLKDEGSLWKFDDGFYDLVRTAGKGHGFPRFRAGLSTYLIAKGISPDARAHFMKRIGLLLLPFGVGSLAAEGSAGAAEVASGENSASPPEPSRVPATPDSLAAGSSKAFFVVSTVGLVAGLLALVGAWFKCSATPAGPPATADISSGGRNPGKAPEVRSRPRSQRAIQKVVSAAQEAAPQATVPASLVRWFDWEKDTFVHAGGSNFIGYFQGVGNVRVNADGTLKMVPQKMMMGTTGPFLCEGVVEGAVLLVECHNSDTDALLLGWREEVNGSRTVAGNSWSITGDVLTAADGWKMYEPSAYDGVHIFWYEYDDGSARADYEYACRNHRTMRCCRGIDRWSFPDRPDPEVQSYAVHQKRSERPRVKENP